MKKINKEHEIDLIEVIRIILGNKFKIILFTILAMTIMAFYLESKPNKKILYSAETTVQPISINENSKYNAYNQYVEFVKSEKIQRNSSYSYENEENKTDLIFTTIDATVLMKLYATHLYEKEIFKKAIIKFNILKKENYTDSVNFYKAVRKLASSINIASQPNNELDVPNKLIIEFQVSDTKKWDDLLNYVDNYINKEIKEYLVNDFAQKIKSLKTFQNFKIEDVSTLLSYNLNNELTTNKLKQQKIILENDKKVIRLEEFFNDTPVVKSSNFFAAKMNMKSTRYDFVNKATTSDLTIIFVAGLFGLLLSIIYFLISYSIRITKHK